MSRALARGALLYLGAVNIGAAALFGYDKFQATRGAWRVPERTLCQSATLGGWPGGFVAMQTFRHKTRKKSFQEKYVAAAGQNAAGVAGILLFVTRSARMRAALMHEMSLFKRILGSGGGRRRR